MNIIIGILLAVLTLSASAIYLPSNNPVNEDGQNNALALANEMNEGYEDEDGYEGSIGNGYGSGYGDRDRNVNRNSNRDANANANRGENASHNRNRINNGNDVGDNIYVGIPFLF